jgi:hypothetical protein
VRVIIDAFAPTAAEVDLAVEVIMAAQAAGWAPIRPIATTAASTCTIARAIATSGT